MRVFSLKKELKTSEIGRMPREWEDGYYHLKIKVND